MGAIRFHFDRGPDGRVTGAQMNQPIPVWRTYEHSSALLRGLGLESSTLPVEIYRNGPRHVLVGVDGVPALSALTPDLRVLAGFPDMAAICFSGDEKRWRIRMFSPAYGVAEDPATGSAAGPVAVHLGRHRLAPFGTWVEISQGIEINRPSTMWARAEGTRDEISSVAVAGSAVVVASGILRA
jgi:trans-2,3-dihydro-3-hydroxyanthranilate isomerase